MSDVGVHLLLLQMLISLKFSISFYCGRECGHCVHLECLMFSILCCLVQIVLLMAVMAIRAGLHEASREARQVNT